MKDTLRTLAAATVALLMITSIMVTGVAADVTTSIVDDGTTSATSASTTDTAPAITVADQYHNPTTVTKVEIPYNASGEISDADNLTIQLYDSNQNFVTQNDSLTDVTGTAILWIPDGNFSGDETVTVELIDDNDPQNALATDSGTLLADTSPPTFSNPQLIDLKDGDGTVSDGDAVEIRVEVTDADSGVKEVTADPTDFGAFSGPLTQVPGTNIWNATFTVGQDGATAPDGDYNVTITAYDNANNQNTTDTNPLTLNTDSGGTSAPSSLPDAPFLDTADDRFEFGTSKDADIYYNASGLVGDASDLTIEVKNESGDTIATETGLSAVSGSTTIGFPADTFQQPQETITVFLNNSTAGTELINTTATYAHGSETVVSSTVTANQSSFDDANLSKDITFAADLLQVQLEDARQTGAEKYDLESLGATDTTQFWINITVENFTPRLLLGAAQNTEWEVTEVDSTTAHINISVMPAETQYNESKLFTPSLSWADSNQADVKANHSVGMAVDDLSMLPSQRQDTLDGTMLMTDAQEFGSPQYDETTETLSLYVAAPSVATDGGQNQGFMDALLTNDLLNEWGVSSASELSISAMGTATNPASATWTSGGLRVYIPHTYSEGTIEISANTGPDLSNATISDDGGDGIVTDGEQVTISVDASNVDSVTADASDFGASSSVSLSNTAGDTWAATITADGSSAPDDGSYSMTITGEDSNGNTTTAETNTLETDFHAPEEAQVINATSKLDVWDRAILPLRADTSNAANTVENAIWTVSLDRDGSSFGETSMNKDKLAVYETGQSITLTFDDGRAVAETQLAGEDITVIAARLEPDRGMSLTDINTLGDVRDLLTDENVNANATFHEVGAAQLDSNGDASFTFTPGDPGQYVVFATSNASNSVSVVQNGNLSVTGQTTLLGVDQVAVQRGDSTISTDQSAYAPGDNVSVTLATDSVIQTSGNVTHTVFLYDEDTFVNQSFTIAVDGELTNTSTLSENVTLEHDIQDVNGVWAVRDTLGFGDRTVSPRYQSGQFSFGEILDFAANETNVSMPKNVATGTVVWNASATVINSSADATAVVETLNSWPEGEYRLIHVATSQDGTELATNTETVIFDTAQTPANVQYSNLSITPGDGGQVNVSGTASASVDIENLGGQDGSYSAKLLVNGTEVDNVSGTIAGGDSITESLSTIFDSTGTYNVTLVAGDQQTTANLTVVTPDTTPPTIVLVSPTKSEIPYGTDITVNVTDPSGVSSVSADVPGMSSQDITSAANPRTISTSGADEGTQTVTVTATDAKGNQVSKTFTFDFVSAPSIDSVTPTAGSTIGQANPWLNITYSDDTHGGSESGVNTTATKLTIDGSPVDLSGAATNSATNLNVTVGPLSSGTHTARLTVTDEAGHSTTKSWKFTVDASPPTVSISTDRTNVSATTPAKLSVTANDAYLDSAKIQVRNDTGTHYEADISSTAKVTSGTISHSFDGASLADGTYEAVINASDSNGNTATQNVTLVVDNSAPSITGTPQVGNASALAGSGAILTNDEIRFLVNASDLTDISSATYSVVRKSSGSKTGVSGSFTQNETKNGVDLTSLDSGEYKVRVTLVDHAGNEHTETLTPTINLDRTPPGISTVVTQKDSSTLWVNVTTSEPLADAPTVTLSNSTYSDTVTFTEFGSQTTYNGTIERPADGDYDVNASGTDLAGNVGADNSTTELDSVSGTQGSQVTVINERTGSFLEINLSTDVSNELITLAGSDTTAFNLPPGMAADRFDQFEFNNSAIENVTIGIKAKPGNKPAWATFNSIDIRFWNTTTKSWEVVPTTYVQNYNISKYSGTHNGSDYWIAERDHLSEHAPSASDTQPPTITYTSPEEKEYGADNTTITVDASIEDAETGVNESSIQLLINGSDETGAATITSVDSNNFTLDYDITGLSPGDSKNVTIVAEDDAGNSTSETVNFSIADDTTEPTLTIEDPNEGKTFPVGTSSVWLNASYADDGSGINTSSVTVKRNDTDLTSAATITDSAVNVSTSGLSSGDYNFTVSVTDNNGNTATETVNFTIDADTTEPEITIEDVNNGNDLAAGTDSTTITATVNDTGVGVDATSIQVLYNGLDKTGSATVTDQGDGNYSVSYTASSLSPNSQHNLTIVAADDAGNQDSATELFNVSADTTKPTITIDSPTDGSVAKTVSSDSDTTNVTIELSLSDDVTGIDTSQTQFLFNGTDVTPATTHDASSVTYTATNLGTGTYSYTLNIRDNAGNAATKTGSFDITVQTSSPGTGPSPTPSQPAEPTPTEPTEPSGPPQTTPRATVSGGQGNITVTTIGAATKVNAKNVSAGASVTLELPTDDRDEQLADTGASINELRLGFAQDGSFDANVSYSATKPSADVPDINPGDEDAPFGYINVEHDASDEVLSEVTFQFSVSKSKLSDRGLAASNVRLFRYNDGRWKSYKTSVENETDSTYVLEATVPGLSVFAIGTTEQETTDFEVTDASVSSTDVGIGEDFDVTATVSNDGNADGEFTAELEIDGETMKTQTVEVPAGESREVAFTWEFGAEGEYTVSVSGTTAGTVTVTSSQPTTTTTTTTTPEPTTTTTTTAVATTPEPTDDGPIGVPVIAWAFILLAILAGAIIFLYRQGYFE